MGFEFIGTYILNGKRPEACADIMKWAQSLETTNRHVAHDHIGEVWVSTVFLGVDHNFMLDGPPLLFETMVFVNGRDANFGFDRYATWEEAEAGHSAAVSLARAVLANADNETGSLIARLKEKINGN